MRLVSTYGVKIKHYNSIFKDTVSVYRDAVEYFVCVVHRFWETIRDISGLNRRLTYVEQLCIRTAARPDPVCPFEDAAQAFYKFPSYLRRAAINEALGKVSSYQSNLALWDAEDPKKRGKQPSLPRAGYVYPALYQDNMYIRTGTYEAKVKVFIRNTWDWITVNLRKSDVDYITHHCSGRKECVPTLQKRGKEWYLDFAFKEERELHHTDPENQRILACDLGINQACVLSVMHADGTVIGREFCSFPVEKDRLHHALGRIKKAQKHGNTKTPRLWARANGINKDIAAKTAGFIIRMAVSYDVDTIVFEYLDLTGKKRGGKKQRLHLWKAKEVQRIVTHQAHRFGMRIARVNARNTSRLAFDGSGRAERGTYFVDGVEKYNYSVCVFPSGKIYHCDLNASYNIGARYFIRELLKPVPETERLDIQAKVPECARRSTCTLSTLISLNAAFAAVPRVG